MQLFFLTIPVLQLALGARECDLPIDVMFLQDTTATFDDDIPNIARQIADFSGHINSLYPGSRFGVAEFRDKPYFPLGYDKDFCYRLSPEGRLTSDVGIFRVAYTLLKAGGGADLPEAQFQGLVNVALDSQVGWRHLRDEQSSTDSSVAARIVVLVTDAVPHIAGDVAKFTTHQNFPSNSGVISTGDPTFECIKQDYPSPAQVASALKSQNIHLLVMIPPLPGVEAAWRWVSETLLEQSTGYVQITHSDSADFSAGLQKALEAAGENIRCASVTSTSTAAPTTTLLTAVTTSLKTAPNTESESPDCSKCPCADTMPCDACDSTCEGAVYIRLAKKPQHLQVVVDNE